jgi:hypothetical protein
MPEVHLTGKAGKQIPARSQYGKDTGENEDAQEVGIFGIQWQEEQKEKKEDDNDTGRENEHFVSDYGKQFSKIKQNQVHVYPVRKPRCLAEMKIAFLLKQIARGLKPV